VSNDAARRQGLTNVQNIRFDGNIDETTGKTIMKTQVDTIADGQQVLITMDPDTGEQIIHLIPQAVCEQSKTKMIMLSMNIQCCVFIDTSGYDYHEYRS
jgi:5S rRNA maturation endonuclease (ribonuclease M5)